MSTTVYRPEFVQQAEKLCKFLGATNAELAAFFGVTERCILKWMDEKPEFHAAATAGKLDADAEVAAKLYHRATGYSHPDVDIKVVDGCIVETPLIKHYPPDTVACIFWLTNRQRGHWRRKPTEESHADIERELKEVTVKLKKLELAKAESGDGSDNLANQLAELIKKLPG